ncbi:MAG TPA: spore cortex biosynthesis protein YabQ, partial [Bacilli bacterium]|nr:spore cortex biosynthesis protein YabQ [Bacilli bacterium]
MSLTIQVQTMLAMIGMGLYVGAALDTYGRFVKRRNTFHLVTAFNDILFWLVQGLFIFYILFSVNNGELRVYIFLALLCGYAAYQSLFRSIYLRLLEWFISFIVGFYRFMRKVFITIFIIPVKTILKLLFTLCMMI